jgi:hypothetical protein
VLVVLVAAGMFDLFAQSPESNLTALAWLALTYGAFAGFVGLGWLPLRWPIVGGRHTRERISDDTRSRPRHPRRSRTGR